MPKTDSSIPRLRDVLILSCFNDVCETYIQTGYHAWCLLLRLGAKSWLSPIGEDRVNLEAYCTFMCLSKVHACPCSANTVESLEALPQLSLCHVDSLSASRARCLLHSCLQSHVQSSTARPHSGGNSISLCLSRCKGPS